MEIECNKWTKQKNKKSCGREKKIGREKKETVKSIESALSSK